MKNFRTYNVAMNYYKMGQKIKIDDSIMKDQFYRASLSIVLNLAEGSGKFHHNDRRKFYSIALGSLRETQSIIDLINAKSLAPIADQLGAMIYKLIQNAGGTQPNKSALSKR